MLQFIFKIGAEKVDLAKVHNPTLKKSFEDLTTSLRKHFEAMTCTAHRRGPVITLHNDGSQAVLAGFGSCCEELNTRVKDRLKDLGYDTSSFTWATTSKYTTM
mgnify:CR=1 FL=1